MVFSLLLSFITFDFNWFFQALCFFKILLVSLWFFVILSFFIYRSKTSHRKNRLLISPLSPRNMRRSWRLMWWIFDPHSIFQFLYLVVNEVQYDCKGEKLFHHEIPQKVVHKSSNLPEDSMVLSSNFRYFRDSLQFY